MQLRPEWRSFPATFVLGLVAACICSYLNTPLPWMIGPLFATAAACMSGIRLKCPLPVRNAGQWAIGTTLGLYFTPVVMAVLASYAGFIVGGVVFALLLGMGTGWLLHKLSGVDRTTAFFAMAVGGAAEMSTLGERHGAKVDRVAAAHSVRILTVVVVIPFGFQFSGLHGLDPYVQATRLVDYGGLAQLMLLTAAAALLLRCLGSPNAWVLGPMFTAIALTGSGISFSAMPEWVSRLGQLFVGISLGTRFTQEFLHTAPRYMVSAALCTIVAILVAIGFALGLSYFSGIHPATAILATSPGGIAEMSLTAKTLELGVPIVTAFHAIRMSAVVLVIGPLFRWIRLLQLRTRNC